MHLISSKQLEGNYRHMLASSSGDHNKKLWAIISIKTDRFHIDERLHFEVWADNELKHVGDKVSLAVKAYNKIQGINKQKQMPVEIVPETDPILCETCMSDTCPVKVRGTTLNVRRCVSYKPKK